MSNTQHLSTNGMLSERRLVSLYLSRAPALWRRLSSFQCLNPQMLFAFQVQSNLHLLPFNIILPLEISCLSIRGLARSHFFIPLSAHSTDSLLYPHPNKAFGCSWRWYTSRGSIVAAHCGNHINMNADPTFSNCMCAHYKMCNLAWWVQIMCTGLVASLVTGIPKRWGSKSVISNDGNQTNRPLIISYSTVQCVLPNSFAMKWSHTLHPSVMLLPQHLVRHKSGAADSRVRVYVS